MFILELHIHERKGERIGLFVLRFRYYVAYNSRQLNRDAAVAKEDGGYIGIANSS